MPSKSKAQHNLMAMVAHDPKAAKRVGIPQSVGQEFVSADKGKSFKSRPELQGINKPKTSHGSMALYKKGGETMATKKLFGGKETYKEEMKEAKALKSGKISERGFVKGEKSEGHKEENSAKIARSIKSGKMSPASYAKMESKEPKGYARGGGIEVRGKTKGKMITMKKGGKC